MSYLDCLACKQAGTDPVKGDHLCVVYDPAIQMPGSPTIQGQRLSANFMAARAYSLGIASQMEDYKLPREALLVACGGAGLYGPRRLRKVFGEWAQVAGRHLWYGCINIPDPPTKEGA